jgi:hypothetical protein
LEYQARTAEWGAQNANWQATLEAIATARQAGNRDREDAALQASVLQSLELARLQTRVDGAATALETARRELEDALDLQRDALAAEYARASPAQRANLDIRNRGIENQYRELQIQRSATVGPQLFFWPQLKVDARDSPADLIGKADLLRREIDNALGHIQRVDDEIGRLEQRLALLRRQNDSRASRDLFDAASPPVGPPSRPASGTSPTGGAGDPQTVPLADRPLEEQIAALRETRDQLELMVQQLRATAATIRGVQGVARGPGGGQ